MSFRIEIKFVGEAPADELARAKILGGVEVHAAIVALQQNLEAAGLSTTVSAQSIRVNGPRHKIDADLLAATQVNHVPRRAAE